MTDFTMGLLVVWTLFNVVAAYIIVIGCFANSEYDELSLLFYPLLVGKLRERLNIVGTVIITCLVSIICLPAIIIYFLTFGIFLLGLAATRLFMYVFGRKD